MFPIVGQQGRRKEGSRRGVIPRNSREIRLGNHRLRKANPCAFLPPARALHYPFLFNSFLMFCLHRYRSYIIAILNIEEKSYLFADLHKFFSSN